MSAGDGTAGAFERFPFAFAPAYAVAARPFGITPETAEARLEAERLWVRYGPWRLRTPYTNIASVSITGPYRFVKTAGPARLGITDLGLTFASNGDVGVLLEFRRRLPGIEPTGRLRHGELTLTVADPARFAGAIRERILAAQRP